MEVLQDTRRRDSWVGRARQFGSGESSQAPCLQLSAAPGLTAPRDVLSLSSWLVEDGAESPRAQHGFSKAYRNPGRIHANPEQSGITTRSCPQPCSSGHAVLCLRQETCCWASPGASASGRTALSTQELLAITSLQKLPPPSLLLCWSVSWWSTITKWGHAFTRADMCIYFSLLPFF